jgi:hypothetical protein
MAFRFFVPWVQILWWCVVWGRVAKGEGRSARSANGASYRSPGQRPGTLWGEARKNAGALKGRPNACFLFSSDRSCSAWLTTLSWTCLFCHDLSGKRQCFAARHDELHSIRIPSYSTTLNKCFRVSARYLEIVNIAIAAIRDEQPIGCITTEHVQVSNVHLNGKRQWSAHT